MDKIKAKELAKSILNIGKSFSHGERIDMASVKIIDAFPFDKKIIVEHKFDGATLKILEKIGNMTRLNR